MTQQHPNQDILENSAEAAENNYEISDYENSSELSSGSAVTREQLSDVYAAGTSDGLVQLGNTTVKVPNEGFDHEVSNK